MKKDATYTNKVKDNWQADINRESGLKTFLSNSELLSKPGNAKIRNQIHHEVFTRFDCLQCANCCKTTPPIFLPSDVNRIAAFLDITPEAFIEEYILEDVDGTYVGIKVPCQFLNGDNTCSIYEVRPQACRQYPHTDEENFHIRPHMNYENTIVCPATHAIVKRLMEAISE